MFFTMQTTKHKAIDRLNIIKNKNFYLFDNIIDFEELLMMVAEYKIKFGIDAVFIDNSYQLFTCPYHSEKEIVAKLKLLAKRLNVVIIITDIHKFSTKRLTFDVDLRHNSLIKYADKILSINRPDLFSTKDEQQMGLVEKDIAKISIDKNMENYNNYSVKLRFDKTTYEFKEIF